MKNFIDYVIEANISDLTDGTEQYRDNPKKGYPQAAKVEVLKITPSLGVKTITFYGEVPSFTKSSKYNLTVMFKDVQFSETQDEPDWKFVDNGQIQTWFNPPSYSENDCFVRCSCLDFRFRWMIGDKDKNALFGQLIPYTKKTNRPPLNPDKIPGYCKHTYNFLRGLSQNGYVRE